MSFPALGQDDSEWMRVRRPQPGFRDFAEAHSFNPEPSATAVVQHGRRVRIAGAHLRRRWLQFESIGKSCRTQSGISEDEEGTTNLTNRTNLKGERRRRRTPLFHTFFALLLPLQIRVIREIRGSVPGSTASGKSCRTNPHRVSHQ